MGKEQSAEPKENGLAAGKKAPPLQEIPARVLAYLNQRTGKRYRVVPGNMKHINARLKEGYLEEDFLLVIDTMSKKWLGDPKMDQYLRPETLFNGVKFDGYLNLGRSNGQGKQSGTDGDHGETAHSKYDGLGVVIET